VFTVVRVIYGRNYFLFNLIVVTLNATLGILTSVMLDNWIANIGYPIVGLMSIMVLFLSCSKRVTKIFLSVNEFGTHGVHGGEGQETEGQDNEGSGEGQETEGQETEGSAEGESDDEGKVMMKEKVMMIDVCHFFNTLTLDYFAFTVNILV
jgi:hypothetical protein